MWRLLAHGFEPAPLLGGGGFRNIFSQCAKKNICPWEACRDLKADFDQTEVGAPPTACGVVKQGHRGAGAPHSHPQGVSPEKTSKTKIVPEQNSGGETNSQK